MITNDDVQVAYNDYKKIAEALHFNKEQRKLLEELYVSATERHFKLVKEYKARRL